MEFVTMIMWLIVIGSIIFVLMFLVVPPIVWRVYRGYIAPLEDRYLTFWPRFWASWVDAVVLSPLIIIFAVLLLLNTAALLIENARWLMIIFYLISQTSLWFYSIYMHGRWGQTAGKMVTRVRIVDAITEEPISYRKAFRRDSLPILIALPLHIYTIYRIVITGQFTPQFDLQSDPLGNPGDWAGTIAWVWVFAELATMLTNKKRRAIHDYIAGTVVVRTNVEAEEAQRSAERPGSS